MATWEISGQVKEKILVLAKELDNDIRVLFILKNLGPQRFTKLEETCALSRSTISKYLKLHLEQKNVEKKIYSEGDLQETRYFLTNRGEEKLHEDFSDKEESLFFINELNENISRLSNLVDFYEKIGVDESIVFQIVRILTKIGDKFFQLEQSRDLYLTLFYIINYNSILTPDYKLNKKQFCEVYGMKALYLDFYIDRIMSSDMGFFMFKRGNDEFFFHQEDLLGTTTFRLVKDHLLEEIIYLNLIGQKKIYDLDKEAEKIAERLKKMSLIWEAVREQFEILIKKLIVKTAIDMGISRTFLTDLVIQSEKLSKSPEEKKSLINIIEGSNRYEDLNVIKISDKEKVLDAEEEKKLDEILAQVQGKGFCPHCGKIILERDFSNRCLKCNLGFDPKKLLKSIDKANEASMRFKQETLLKEELIKCPNESCDANVLSQWKECPVCHTAIRKS